MPRPDWSPCGYRVPESGLGTQLGPHHPPSVHTRLSMVCTPDSGRLHRLSPPFGYSPCRTGRGCRIRGSRGGGREQHQASIRRTSSPRSWRSSRGASGSAARSLCAVLSGRGWRPLLPSLPRAVMLRRETFPPRSRCPPRRRAAGLLGQTDRSHLGGRIPPSGCGSGSAPIHCGKGREHVRAGPRGRRRPRRRGLRAGPARAGVSSRSVVRSAPLRRPFVVRYAVVRLVVAVMLPGRFRALRRTALPSRLIEPPRCVCRSASSSPSSTCRARGSSARPSRLVCPSSSTSSAPRTTPA